MTEPKKQRIVVGLTTIPSRCDKLEETLVSLASQTLKPDAILISVPKMSKREGVPYPVPNIAKTVKRILPGVGKVVVLDEDYGPLTKLIGPLFNEPDPETIIITVDDDQRYGKNMVATLLAGARAHPGSVVCRCGHVIGKFPHLWGYRINRGDRTWPLSTVNVEPGSRVDIVSGFCGVLYPRGVFGTAEDIPDPAMEALRKDTLPILNKHDDLYISGWLDLLGVEKYVVDDGDEADKEQSLPHSLQNSLSTENNGRTPIQGAKHLNEFWAVVRALRSRGMLVSNLQVKWYNSMTFLVMIGGVVILAGAAASYYAFSNYSEKARYKKFV